MDCVGVALECGPRLVGVDGSLSRRMRNCGGTKKKTSVMRGTLSSVYGTAPEELLKRKT